MIFKPERVPIVKLVGGFSMPLVGLAYMMSDFRITITDKNKNNPELKNISAEKLKLISKMVEDILEKYRDYEYENRIREQAGPQRIAAQSSQCRPQELLPSYSSSSSARPSSSQFEPLLSSESRQNDRIRELCNRGLNSSSLREKRRAVEEIHELRGTRPPNRFCPIL